MGPATRRALQVHSLRKLILTTSIVAAVLYHSPTVLEFLNCGAFTCGKRGNETSAIGALRTITRVQVQYRALLTGGQGAPTYATSLRELSHAGLIDNVLGSGTKSGYRFRLWGDGLDWSCRATPVSTFVGSRNFIVCTDGRVRFSGSGPATGSSPTIQ